MKALLIEILCPVIMLVCIALAPFVMCYYVLDYLLNDEK